MGNFREESKNSKLILGLLIISLTLMMLLVTPPATYADDSNGSLLPPVPVMPPATGKFPGYKPVKTTGAVLPPNVGGKAAPPSKPALLPSWTSYPIDVCSGQDFTGVAPVAGGEAIEDWKTGNLWFYNTATKSCNLIKTPPSGASAGGYYGLAAQGSLVALISFDAQGLWTCTLSTSNTCKATSAFIPLPSAYCSSTPAGRCFPLGIAFDKTGNLWFVDKANAGEVELSKASHYSTVVAHRGPYCVVGQPGCYLDDIVIDSAGNHWVSDGSCPGNIRKNGLVVFSAGDEVEGLTISTLNPAHAAHLYVSVENFCGNYPYPFVGDATDLVILPHPYTSGSDEMNAISTQLYFSDSPGDIVWVTAEP